MHAGSCALARILAGLRSRPCRRQAAQAHYVRLSLHGHRPGNEASRDPRPLPGLPRFQRMGPALRLDQAPQRQPRAHGLWPPLLIARSRRGRLKCLRYFILSTAPSAAACDWQTDHLVPVPLRTMLTEPARFGAAQQACRRHPRKRQQRHADICLKVVVRASTPLLHSIPDLEPVHVPGSNSHVCLVLARLKQLDPLPFHTPQLRWTLAIVSGHFRPRLQSSAKSLPKNKRKFKRREKKSRLSSQRTRRTWGS